MILFKVRRTHGPRATTPHLLIEGCFYIITILCQASFWLKWLKRAKTASKSPLHFKKSCLPPSLTRKKCLKSLQNEELRGDWKESKAKHCFINGFKNWNCKMHVCHQLFIAPSSSGHQCCRIFWAVEPSSQRCFASGVGPRGWQYEQPTSSLV